MNKLKRVLRPGARPVPYEFEGKQTVFVIDDVDHVTMLLASEY